LPSISSIGTTSVPSKWPHCFGNTWSSIWTAATPARSKARSVLRALIALPKPVSMSATTGTSTASQIRSTCWTTSDIVVRPTSGWPRIAFAMPAPVA
jgi:hypothetical protein